MNAFKEVTLGDVEPNSLIWLETCAAMEETSGLDTFGESSQSPSGTGLRSLVPTAPVTSSDREVPARSFTTATCWSLLLSPLAAVTVEVRIEDGYNLKKCGRDDRSPSSRTNRPIMTLVELPSEVSASESRLS